MGCWQNDATWMGGFSTTFSTKLLMTTPASDQVAQSKSLHNGKYNRSKRPTTSTQNLTPNAPASHSKYTIRHTSLNLLHRRPCPNESTTEIYVLRPEKSRVWMFCVPRNFGFGPFCCTSAWCDFHSKVTILANFFWESPIKYGKFDAPSFPINWFRAKAEIAPQTHANWTHVLENVNMAPKQAFFGPLCMVMYMASSGYLTRRGSHSCPSIC